MFIVDAVVVIAVVVALVYGTTWLLGRTQPQPHPAAIAGTWRVAHRDVEGETQVVLQKVAVGGAGVVDEHVIAMIRTDDPRYDEKFLTAMEAARQRRALFEAEEDG